jgi:hypothetical protein
LRRKFELAFADKHFTHRSPSTFDLLARLNESDLAWLDPQAAVSQLTGDSLNSLARMCGSTAARRSIDSVDLVGSALVKEVAEKVWLISFMHYDWGSSITRPRASNAPRVRSLLRCYPCHRYKTLPMCPERTRKKWWKGRESNPRPRHYECRALTS